MSTVEYCAGSGPIEKLAGFALVRPPILESWVKIFLATLKAGHPLWEPNVNEILLAFFLACECGEEIHEIPFMIPLFHIRILAGSRDVFCVNPIGILLYVVNDQF